MLLYVIDMTEQLRPKQEEKDNKNGLEISHFERFRNIYSKLGILVFSVIVFVVADGVIKEYIKINPLSHADNEKSVSIATLQQTVAPEASINKTLEKPKVDVPEYIPNCYSTDEMNELINKDIAASPSIDNTKINLKVNTERTQLDIVPTKIPDYAEDVARSTVRVFTDDGVHKSSGTGFVTTDKTGEEVVVTAAHAVIENKTETIKVVDFNDKMFDIVGGCTIYGHINKNGQYIPVESYQKSGGDNFDVAVLKVKESDKLPAPLSVLTSNLNRGEWVYVNNYQIKTDGTIPSTNEASKFYMVVGQPGLGFVEMLDGLTAENVISKTKYSDRNLPGASGGPAFNINGYVAGIAYSTESRWHYLYKTDLLKQYNATISSKDDQLIKPVFTFYSNSQIINEALVSPVLQNQSN